MNEQIKTEYVEYSYDVDFGNHIKGLIYKRETNLAVMFGRLKDNKICWIPKSAIKGSLKRDRNIQQNISISFPITLEWQKKKFLS